MTYALAAATDTGLEATLARFTAPGMAKLLTANHSVVQVTPDSVEIGPKVVPPVSSARGGNANYKIHYAAAC